MSIESEIDAATERGKKMAATRLADDLERLCCAETETQFFDYVTDRAGSIIALLRVALVACVWLDGVETAPKVSAGHAE